MLYKYSEFIKEGQESSASCVYWDNAEFKKVLENDWSEIFIKKFSDKFQLIFRIGPDKYDFCSVILDKKNNNDLYLLENEEIVEKFKKKFNLEFWKNATEYVKNMKYDPKCLGDVSHVRDADRYNV